MVLPEHTCISCVYLIQPDRGIIPHNQREKALIDENDRDDNSGINYERLACYKGNQDYSRFDLSNMVLDIRNIIVKPNSCKDWLIFQEVSPDYLEQNTDYNLDHNIEQGTSKKLVNISIMVAKKALAIAFIGMVVTFIITMITWYLD